MKIKISSGHCLGYVRLSAIDMGFDLRKTGRCIILPQGEEADRLMREETTEASSGVGFDGKDGKRRLMHGSRDEIARELARNGYLLVAALTPNGREIRCEPKNPDVFVCQPPNDNYWLAFPTIAAALAQFDKKAKNG